jgi:hypothetical protein
MIEDFVHGLQGDRDQGKKTDTRTSSPMKTLTLQI